jgi:hypothetical protein
MSSLPPDDVKLTNFLRQYRTGVPPASPDLEDRILAQVYCSPHRLIRSQRRRIGFVFALSAIAAVFTYRLMHFTTVTELSSLQNCLESNWNTLGSSDQFSAFNDPTLNDLTTN